MPSNEKSDRVSTLMAGLAGEGGEAGSVGGVTLEELVQRFGTPLYVYSGDLLVAQLQRLQRALGPETHVVFSVKANPSLGVCQLLARHGAGIEVASHGELLLAQRAGFAPEDTLFAGPGKSDEELSAASAAGIFAINVESVSELERLGAIARARGEVAGVGLRINPRLELHGAGMRMGGGPQRFGIDEELIADVCERLRHNPHLRARGPHVYTGTQVFDVDALVTHIEHVVKIARQMADALSEPLEMIDFGGGFGVPYFEGGEPFDLERFGTLYRRVVETCRADARLSEARFIIELGRYLVAEAGVYVTRVVDVKESRGETFVVTDGGMNHHITATGNFGQVFRKAYPLSLLNRANAPSDSVVSIVGPCCTPLDTLAHRIPFPEARVGDLVGVFMSGAYGYSASSLRFLSHATPAEVMVHKGRVHELRPRGRPEDVLADQRGIDITRRRQEAALAETG